MEIVLFFICVWIIGVVADLIVLAYALRKGYKTKGIAKTISNIALWPISLPITVMHYRRREKAKKKQADSIDDISEFGYNKPPTIFLNDSAGKERLEKFNN
jgi:hypothetical protein